MDRVAATMPSQAHAGAAQEAPDIGQWEGQDVPLVRPSSCNVKGGIPSSRRYLPTYLFLCGLLDLPCARLDSPLICARPVWTSGPVLDPYWLVCEPLLDRGSFVGFCGPLVNFWLDHCCTVLDSWVISSLVFQLELFVSLPCSEGLQWAVSLKASAGFFGTKFGWVEIGKNGRFTRFKSS